MATFVDSPTKAQAGYHAGVIVRINVPEYTVSEYHRMNQYSNSKLKLYKECLLTLKVYSKCNDCKVWHKSSNVTETG